MSSQDTERTGGVRPQVFISHGHDDKDIADVLRDFLRTVTAGVVPVFQSSYAGSGPRLGDIPQQYGT